MTKDKRHSRFVDPKVQGALVRRFLLHWFTFVISSFGLLFIWQLLVSGDPVYGYATVLRDIWTYNLPVFVVLLVMLPILILDTIKLSNRFAGPIVRLRESLRDLADGVPVARLQFRQNDFWTELADIFNRAVQRTQQGAKTDEQDSKTEVEVGA